MKVTIGVDPGATGAIAILDQYGQILDLIDMPASDGMVFGSVIAAHVLEHWAGPAQTVAWVEHVHAMPKQGVASTFKFGTAWGVVLGALSALNVPTHLVTPSTWKRTAGLTSDKGQARRRASERWPSHAAMFARVKDDGRAEACLIAEHGRTRTT